MTHFNRLAGPEHFSIERVYEDVRAHMPRDVRVTPWICPFRSKGMFRRLCCAVLARRHQRDVNHVTGDVHFVTFFLTRRRTVLTMHDCLMVERARGLKRLLLWLFWMWLPEKRSARIVAISEEGKRRVLHQLDCSPDKIVVLHNPVSEAFRPVEKRFDETCPRILQVGTQPNKNVERLAEALRGLDVTLAVVGPLSVAQRTVLRQNGIRFENMTGLSEDGMRRQYEMCDILAFCSTSEGFGLPIVEAQAVGRPVVTGTVPPLPEVGGEGALYADPFDAQAMRCALRRVIEDPALRAELVRRGFDNARRFRADAVAARYAALYREVAGKSGPVR